MEETHAQITSRDVGNGIVISLLTPKLLEEAVIAELEELLMQAIKQANVPNIVLDFEKVDFLSSAVLRVLIKINVAIRERKGRLRLCSVKPKILEVFKITQLNKIFDIRQNVDAAVASLK
jgi:anti-sigma B factor antagonist